MSQREVPRPPGEPTEDPLELPDEPEVPLEPDEIPPSIEDPQVPEEEPVPVP